MRVILFLALTIASATDICTISFASMQTSSESEFAEQSAPIQLTVSEIGRTYCKGDNDVYVLKLHLRLLFQNIGKRKVILRRNYNKITRLMISDNLEDAYSQKYKVVSDITEVSANESMVRDSTSFEREYIIIPPGGYYKTESQASVIVAHRNYKPPTSVITEGEKFLQIEVIDSTVSQREAERLRDLWGSKGILRFQPVTSLPLKVRVDEPSEFKDCAALKSYIREIKSIGIVRLRIT
jgi:hypothetical protein